MTNIGVRYPTEEKSVGFRFQLNISRVKLHLSVVIQRNSLSVDDNIDTLYVGGARMGN